MMSHEMFQSQKGSTSQYYADYNRMHEEMEELFPISSNVKRCKRKVY